MADSRTLQLLITAKDQASKTLDGVKGSLANAEDASKAFGVGLLAVGAGVAAFGTMAVKAFQDSEFAGKRLEQISKQVTHSTDAEIQSFRNLAGALQKVGVVEDDVIIAGQSQLASFAKSSQTVTELTDDLADLAVAQYGVNVTQDQTIQTANLMGKALSGQLGALTRTGILVNDEFAKAFENANNEQERAVIISQIIQDNYGGLNKAMRETSEGGLQSLKNNFGDFMEVVGAKIIPLLNNLVNSLDGFVQNTLPNLITRFEETIEWFKQNEWAIYAIAGAIIGGLVPAIYSMITAFLASAVALAPFLIGGAIIGGIIAGIVWIVKNWDMLKAKAFEIFSAIGGFISGIWESIKEVTMSVWNSISGFFEGVWNVIKNIFVFTISLIVGLVASYFSLMGVDIFKVFDSILLYMGMFWNFLKSFFQAGLDGIKLIWELIWGAILAHVTSMWEGIKGIVSGGFAIVSGIFKYAIKPLGDLWNGLWNSMGDKVTGVWDSVKNKVKDSINWIIRQINSFISSANSIASKGNVFGVNVPQIPDIPYLAKGGIVNKPTLAMIGEAGPEAVVPLGKGGGFGGGVTINITAGTIVGRNGMEEFVNMINEKLTDKLNLNGIGI